MSPSGGGPILAAWRRLARWLRTPAERWTQRPAEAPKQALRVLSPRRAWQELARFAASPVPARPLALFRIAVGGVVVLESVRLLWPSPGGSLLAHSFLAPLVPLPYPGLGWVVPLPEPWTSIEVAFVGAAALLVAVGHAVRPAAAVAAVGWTHLWLAEASLYNDHYYLASLLLALLASVPSDRALRWPRRPPPRTVPLGAVALVRVQLALVYFFAGVAKLTPEWWLHGEPLRTQLRSGSTQERIASLFSAEAAGFAASDDFALVLSRAGTLLDLGAGIGLLVPRTRALVATLLVGFHAANHFVLFDDIGLFPLLGVATLAVFVPNAGASRRRLQPAFGVLGAAGMALVTTGIAWPLGAPAAFVLAALAGAVGGSLAWPPTREPRDRTRAATPSWKLVAGLVFVAIQLLLPARHWLIPGEVGWTGQGARFAWQMKAVAKKAGPLRIRLEDAEVVRVESNGRAQLVLAAAPPGLAVLIETDPFDAPLESLPAIFGVWTPRLGVRIVSNPRAADPSARESFERRFLRVRNALPYFEPPMSRDETLDALGRITGANGSPGLGAVLEHARRAARTLDTSPIRAEQRFAGERLRAALARLAADPSVGPQVRAELARGEVWLSAGGPRPEVVGDILGGGTLSYGDASSLLSPGALLVGPGLDDPAANWAGLPAAVAIRHVEGRVELRWNAAALLTTRQVDEATTEPDLLLEHVRHAARSWERATGRRPVVNVEANAMLVPWGEQLLVDPHANLALARLRWLRRASWIEPLRRLPASPETGTEKTFPSYVEARSERAVSRPGSERGNSLKRQEFRNKDHSVH